MSFTGSFLCGESSIAMKIRLLKEYGGFDEAGGGGGGGSAGVQLSCWGRGIILARGCNGSRLFL